MVCGGEGGAHVEEEGAQGKGKRLEEEVEHRKEWKEKGEEHREEGEPGGGQRTKGLGT